MKNYEFLECHEWWTERETVQAKGAEGTDYLTVWRGLYIKPPMLITETLIQDLIAQVGILVDWHCNDNYW